MLVMGEGFAMVFGRVLLAGCVNCGPDDAGESERRLAFQTAV